jgi:hypothetical protein
MPEAKHVAVVVQREPEHPRTAHALRSAVGYLTANLRITLILAGPAEALLPACAQPSPALPQLCRHLHTLRALGHLVVRASEVDVDALLAQADVTVTW